MKNSLNKARSTKDKPDWISDKDWDTLSKHWDTDGFKKKSSQGKKIGHPIVEGLEGPSTLVALLRHLNIELIW